MLLKIWLQNIPPKQKNEDKDIWLEKQTSDGYYTSEYYDRNDPAQVLIVTKFVIPILILIKLFLLLNQLEIVLY